MIWIASYLVSKRSPFFPLINFIKHQTLFVTYYITYYAITFCKYVLVKNYYALISDSLETVKSILSTRQSGVFKVAIIVKIVCL